MWGHGVPVSPPGISVDESSGLEQDTQADERTADDDNADGSGLTFSIFVLVGQHQREDAADSQGNADVHGDLDDDINNTAEKAIEIQVGVDGDREYGKIIIHFVSS